MASGKVGLGVLGVHFDALSEVLDSVLRFTEAFVRDGEENVGLLAQLDPVLFDRVLRFDNAPQLTDCLLQVALVQVRNGSVEGRIDIVRVYLFQHLREKFDRLTELLGFDLQPALTDQLFSLVQG